jgi:hypothetical protein
VSFKWSPSLRFPCVHLASPPCVRHVLPISVFSWHIHIV